MRNKLLFAYFINIIHFGGIVTNEIPFLAIKFLNPITSIGIIQFADFICSFSKFVNIVHCCSVYDYTLLTIKFRAKLFQILGKFNRLITKLLLILVIFGFIFEHNQVTARNITIVTNIEFTSFGNNGIVNMCIFS